MKCDMDYKTTTPIHKLGLMLQNDIYIKRDDLIPYSFGGNKVRKAKLFFQEIESGNYDTVVTYGSSSSNHCRIIANMAAAKGIHCHIISTEDGNDSANRKMVTLFNANITVCNIATVSRAIEEVVNNYTAEGKRVYFIQGGGHGNIGTKAYDLAFDEIVAYEQEQRIEFDYIFHASGTGTTQAGLICGKRRCHSSANIIGISIARQNPRGGQIVSDSVKAYCGVDAGNDLFFIDDYICGGYGQYDENIDITIENVLTKYGIPLDPTYTGKAFWGMEEYVKLHQIRRKKLLFIHTGGTPIFYDWVKKHT